MSKFVLCGKKKNFESGIDYNHGFTRTTFRNCALPHDAFGVSGCADAQAEFASLFLCFFHSS
jgi:hypothetical protein